MYLDERRTRDERNCEENKLTLSRIRGSSQLNSVPRPSKQEGKMEIFSSTPPVS